MKPMCRQLRESQIPLTKQVRPVTHQLCATGATARAQPHITSTTTINQPKNRIWAKPAQVYQVPAYSSRPFIPITCICKQHHLVLHRHHGIINSPSSQERRQCVRQAVHRASSHTAEAHRRAGRRRRVRGFPGRRYASPHPPKTSNTHTMVTIPPLSRCR